MLVIKYVSLYLVKKSVVCIGDKKLVYLYSPIDFGIQMWFILLLNYFSDLRVVGVLVNTYMIAFT